MWLFSGQAPIQMKSDAYFIYVYTHRVERTELLVLDSFNDMVSSLVDRLISLIWIADSEYQETNKSV